MSDYVIVAESSCDLPQELVDKLNIVIVPMEFIIGGETYFNYLDHRELPIKKFYDMLRLGAMSKTTQITAARYIEVFEKYLLEGKDILNLCFSSAMSGTYNSSVMAVEELKGKYPDRKIYTIDTKAAGIGQGVLVMKAAEKRLDGIEIDEAKAWVEQHIDTSCQWFVVNEMRHLRRGGRISHLAEVVGTLLNVKPILHVNTEGALAIAEKVMGIKKAVTRLVERMQANIYNPEEQTILIGHGDISREADYLEEVIRSKMNVKNVIKVYIGPIIGTHTGPGMLSLVYLGSGK